MYGMVQRIYTQLGFRCSASLAVGILAGLCGVLVDVDHFLCAAIYGVRITPVASQSGCYLWHSYLLPAGWFIAGLAITCLAGWLCYVVSNAIGAAVALWARR